MEVKTNDLRFPDRSEYKERFLKEIAKEMRSWHEESWEQERDPSTGQKWKPRKPPTGNWPILRKSGRMQDTAKFSSNRASIFAEVVDYGVYHMQSIGPRPWLGIPKNHTDSMEEILLTSIEREIKL